MFGFDHCIPMIQGILKQIVDCLHLWIVPCFFVGPDKKWCTYKISKTGTQAYFWNLKWTGPTSKYIYWSKHIYQDVYREAIIFFYV